MTQNKLSAFKEKNLTHILKSPLIYIILETQSMCFLKTEI